MTPAARQDRTGHSRDSKMKSETNCRKFPLASLRRFPTTAAVALFLAVCGLDLPPSAAQEPQSPPVSADDPAAGPAKPADFESLFDGQTLAGWTNPYDWGTAEVVDGEICLTGERKFFLVTERTFQDFLLEAEVCLPAEGPANSGIMFRCHVEPNRVYGYQAEVDPLDRAWSGGLYDEGRRGWLFPIEEQKGQVRLIQAPRGEWMQYRIVCRGDHFRISINGGLVTDWHDGMDASGHIGLQHHGEKGQTYRFRNIRIRELEPAGRLSPGQ